MSGAELPRGAKRAIRDAFEIALQALDGRELVQIPAARPRTAARLRAAYAALLRDRVIWK